MRSRAIEYFRLDSRPMPRGFDSDTQTTYGSSTESFHAVTHTIKQYCIKRAAEVAKISVRHVRIFYYREASPSERMLAKLLGATVGTPQRHV
jgi:hypothetical protein